MLSKMRSKPEKIKTRLALIFAAAITLMIVSLWLLVIKNKNTDEVAKENSTSSDLKPLFLIFDDIKQGVKDVKSKYKASSADSVSSDSEVVE